jgi:hypothetical protein
MKKIIIGIIIGMMISTTVTAVTKEYILTPASYNITANGENLSDPNYPTLNYKGTTYLSLKKTAEAVGANLNWNAQTKTAELKTGGEIVIEKGSIIKFPALENESEYQHYYQEVSTKYIIKDNIVYIYAMLFEHHFNFDGKRLVINYPKSNTLIIDDIKNNENIFMNNLRVFVKLSALGLNYKIENDTLVIE